MVILSSVTELKWKLIQLLETAPVMIDDRDAEASRYIMTEFAEKTGLWWLVVKVTRERGLAKTLGTFLIWQKALIVVSFKIFPFFINITMLLCLAVSFASAIGGIVCVSKIILQFGDCTHAG